ncbi:MAG TPA: hypothetical protein PKZ49_09195 [Nitrosomonas sp.]|nr:hypothetical protein [Nitrosomonas sp.]
MEMLTEFMGKYPAISSILMVIGILRMINKPLFAILKAVADATPSEADNKLLDAAEKSAVYKGFVFVVDWLASVKLIKQ